MPGSDWRMVTRCLLRAEQDPTERLIVGAGIA